MDSAMEGILPIYKPAGMTSHDVVAKARKLLNIRRIGHTGTLDPQVTGVLPLCVGRATRLVEYIQELPKEYKAVMVFGFATDTEDTTGAIVAKQEIVDLSKEQLLHTIQQFVGEIEQIPPMYSAVKVNGKRLYELAREGKMIERKSRKAFIYDISIDELKLNLECPEVSFHVTCSKGTYIRTLCVDIGRALNVPSVMKKLIRTRTGHFTLEDCVTLEQLEALCEAGQAHSVLIPADQGIKHFPSITVNEVEANRLYNGLQISVNEAAFSSNNQLVRAYENSGVFMGVFQFLAEQRRIVPIKVFRS